MAKQLTRYVLAIVIGAIVGETVGLPLAFALDIIFRGDITGGRWALNTPNVILTLINGGAIGYTAGYIAQRRGKLMAALAVWMPMIVLIIVEVSMNRDILGNYQASSDTTPALWFWIALVPAMIGGHFAVKHRPKVGLAALAGGLGGAALILFSLGGAAFHVFTIVVAYEESGFFAALITAFAPPLSELYLVIKIWHKSGYLTNQYDMRFLLLTGIGIFGLAMYALSAIANRQARRQRPDARL
jgi:hypothetical protein